MSSPTRDFLYSVAFITLMPVIIAVCVGCSDFEEAMNAGQDTSVSNPESTPPRGEFLKEPNGESSPAASTPSRGQGLSLQQRFADRQRVHEFSSDIDKLARVCLTQLRDEFDPSLLALNRALQGSEAPAVLVRTQAEFHTAVQNCEKLRQQFREIMSQLQHNEANLDAPESKS